MHQIRHMLAPQNYKTSLTILALSYHVLCIYVYDTHLWNRNNYMGRQLSCCWEKSYTICTMASPLYGDIKLSNDSRTPRLVIVGREVIYTNFKFISIYIPIYKHARMPGVYFSTLLYQAIADSENKSSWKCLYIWIGCSIMRPTTLCGFFGNKLQ